MKALSKKYFNYIFIIPIKWVFILSFIAFPLVIYSLKILDSGHYIAQISYILSAYTFTVLCVRTPYIYRRSKELIKGEELQIIVLTRKILCRYKYSEKYLYDIEFRASVSLYMGFCFNSFYALYRCFNGVLNKSIWFIAVGLYYLIFGIIRLMLINRIRMGKIIDYKDEYDYFGFKTYRNCGIYILILNLSMVVMIIQMIIQNSSSVNGEIIYFSAIYTFYCVILSITNVVRFSKNKDIILSASKNLNFVGALMSIFTLQTSMIAYFGDGNRRQNMNIITGGVVALFCIITAVFMILKSNKKIKALEKNLTKI